MTKENIFSLFFLAFLVFILVHVFKVFTPFLTTGFWAFIVVFAFFPLYARLEALLKGNRTLAALIMTLAILAILVIPVIYLILYLKGEALGLYYGAKDLVQTGTWKQFLDSVRHAQFVLWLEKQIPQFNLLVGDNLTNLLLDISNNVGTYMAAHVAMITKNIVLFFLHFLLLICLLYLFFRDGRNILKFIYEMTPMGGANKSSVITTLDNTFTAIIRGQFLTSMIQGTIAGCIFALLGVKLYIFFGILTFLGSMVPVIGAAAVWFPISVYLLMTGEVGRGIILLIAGFFGISLIDNILKPIFIGGRAKMSIFLIFLGILGGIQAYGIAGIFVGPVVLAVFFALIKIFHEQYIAS